MLSDSSHEIRQQADSALSEFLQEIKNSPVRLMLLFTLLNLHMCLLIQAEFLKTRNSVLEMCPENYCLSDEVIGVNLYFAYMFDSLGVSFIVLSPLSYELATQLL